MLRAQAAGAAAVVVVNNEAGGALVEMGGDGINISPDIPTVSVSADAGAALRCERQHETYRIDLECRAAAHWAGG